MNEVQIIEKEISIIRENYLRSALAILSDFNNENKTKLDYKGRQIYELLQNADDCYSEICPKIDVKFELRDNILIIQNTGNPFTSRGIISLMRSDASSKYQGMIGCKGLGFRSVLNWANKISIYTKEFNVNFSEESAIAQLEYYKEHCDQDHVQELDRINRIAILSSAEVNGDSSKISQWLDEKFSTAIVLYCNSEYVEAIQKQLIELQFEELLFLKHVRNIHIISSEAERVIEAVDEGESFLIQEGENFTDWTVWKKEGEISQSDGTAKSYELIIAYNNDEIEREKIRKNGVLYSYFKTEIPMPFPFLVHGTFELTSERNGLVKESPNNEALLEVLVDFISEKGAEIAACSKQYDYTALKFLLPAHPLYFLDKQYDFTSKLKRKIKSYKLFPTIGNNYINFEETPRYSNKNFAQYVSPQTFVNLLKPCEDPAVLSYFHELGIGFYSVNEIVPLLNADADEYVASKVNQKLITLFYETYSYSNIAPKLLVDSNGKRITDDNVTIFNNDDDRFALPEWCEMRFIDFGLEKALLSAFNCKPRRLMEILAPYGCAEYSFDSVVRQLVAQCRNETKKTKDLLRWLFESWRNNDHSFKTALTNINIRVISRTGDIIQSSKCYFGKEYGNEIGERITSCLDDVVYVADHVTLGFEENEFSLIKEFLLQLEVKEFPIVEQVTLRGMDFINYQNYNAEKYPLLTVGAESFYCNDRYNGLFYQDYGSRIQVADIIGIEEILTKADYKDILYWLLSDYSLNMRIKNANEVDDASCMRGLPYKKQTYREVRKNQMRSWLRKKFSEVSWLPVKAGGKVNCSGCTMTPHLLSPVVEVLDIDYEALSHLFGKPIKKEVDALFEGLGVADDIVDLSYETIYEILLQLPEIDKNHTLGKNIYTKLNLHFDKEATTRLIKNNSTYQKFRRDGKVLAEINGHYEYRPISEVYYVGKKIYSNDILKNYPILVLNRRAGDEKISQLFGVQSINKIGAIKVTPVIHSLNDEFQTEYQKLLPYIYAKRIDVDSKNKELNLLKSSKILLVEDAITEHIVNGEQKIGKLRNYELIYADKIAYIKIPRSITTLIELKEQIEFTSTAAEVITTILDVDRDKEAYLLIFGKSIKDIEIYFQSIDEMSVVNLAKEKFSQQIDLCHEFWLAVANALSEAADDIQAKYKYILPHDFDYKKINDVSCAEMIIKLFNELGIDVDAYNESAYEPIVLKQYYSIQWRDIKNQYRKKYLCYIAEQMVSQGKKKSDFEQAKKAYDFYEPDFENSVKVDLITVFEDFIGITLDLLELADEDFEQYYSDLEDKDDTENVTPNSELTQGDTSFDEIDYIALNKKIAAVTNGETIIPNLTAPEQHHSGGGGFGHRTGGIVDRKTTLTKETDGFIAESKVYNTLLAKIGENGSVEWISGNGARAGQVKEGNDNCGYDMRYADADGKVHYVEVKGTSSDSLEFILTKNEFNFAQLHKEQFELWFVFIKDGAAGTPHELGTIFVFNEDEDFFHNHRFSVEQTDFRLKAKIDNA